MAPPFNGSRSSEPELKTAVGNPNEPYTCAIDGGSGAPTHFQPAYHRPTLRGNGQIRRWTFIEAGNLIVINQRRLAGSHVVRLYPRIKRAKNHQKAVVAVARHLAEAAWFVLTKQEVYREPQRSQQAL